MLGKLIKHEWKNVSKVGGIMLLAMLVVTVIGCFMLQMPWMQELYMGGENLSEMQSLAITFMLVISVIVYIFMLVGLTYGILIFLGVNFYKSMYSAQGYLAHTLPVTPNQLLFSKTLIAGIWYLLIEISVVISMVALILSFAAGLMGYGDISFGEAFGSVISELGMVLESEFAGTAIHFIVIMVLMLLISPFYALIMIFGGLTIGQLSKKYKALLGVLAYFGLSFINMMVQMVVQMCYTIGLVGVSMQDPSAVGEMSMLGMYDVMVVVWVVMAAIVYFVSHFILSKKLNLD